MIAASTLTVAGLALLWWQPSAARQGFAPRATIVVLLTAAAAVWLGSIGLLAAATAGEHGGLLVSCNALWTRLATGTATLAQQGAVAAWTLLAPGRAAYRLLSLTITTVAVRRRLLRQAKHAHHDAAIAIHVVRGLGTPAMTVGLLRPVILVDAGFWQASLPHALHVTGTHEHAHARGRHGLLDAVFAAATEPLWPIWIARHARQNMRRNLEAAADDHVARRFGARNTGRTLGSVALQQVPSVGLGASGDNLWRVQRLLSPRWSARSPQVITLSLAAGLTAAAAAVLGDALGAHGVGTHVCWWG